MVTKGLEKRHSICSTETESEADDVSLLAIQSPGNKTDFCIKVQLEIQGAEITMELDTGASFKKTVQRELFQDYPAEIIHYTENLHWRTSECVQCWSQLGKAAAQFTSTCSEKVMDINRLATIGYLQSHWIGRESNTWL